MPDTTPTPAICGDRHESYPETVCTQPPAHRMPHGGPLIIGGRECGGAAWGADDGHANTPPAPAPHACDNCEGFDPASCLANPDWQQPDNPDATALARHIADQPISVVQAACRLLGMRLNLRVQDTTAPVADPALVQRVARALAERYAHGNPGSGMMDHFIAADSYPSMAPVTPNDAASVVLAELAPELALLAELTEARQHGAYTYCPQLVGHVNVTAFARKINEKITAVAQRDEAVQYAREQRQRAETAEARIAQGLAVAEVIDANGVGWAADSIRRALTPTADTPKEPTT